MIKEKRGKLHKGVFLHLYNTSSDTFAIAKDAVVGTVWTTAILARSNYRLFPNLKEYIREKKDFLMWSIFCVGWIKIFWEMGKIYVENDDKLFAILLL